MKLGPDETRRLFLGCLLAAGVIYVYFTLLLGPLSASQAAARKAIGELGPQIKTAKAIIASKEAAEKRAPAARETLAQVDAMIPPGSPVAWFPPQVADLFKTHRIEKATTRLITDDGKRDLPGYRWSLWGIEFPKVEFGPFGLALVEFENQQPLVAVTNVTIEANRENFESQRVVLTVGNIVKK